MIIGFTNGCFNYFHEGHRHFLTNCRRHCHYLIVAVNTDAYCALKHPEAAIDNLKQRMFHVRAYAEAVFPFDGYEEGLIVHIRPHVLFKGYDHSTDVSRGTAQVAQGIDCAIVQIPHLPGYSTTEVIREAERHALHRA